MLRPGSVDFRLVHGHIWPNDGIVLQALMAGKKVLEIGTCTGMATVAIASTATHVTTIDWGKGDGQMGAFSPEHAQATIYNYADASLVMCLVGDWVEILPTLDISEFQGIFYDAAHEPPYAYEKDFLATLGGYKGIVALHDYKPTEKPMQQCVAAIDQFEKDTGRRRYGPLPGSSVVWFAAVQ